MYKINDLEGASWAFRKLAETNKEMECLIRHADDERKRIDEWLERETESLKGDATFFTTIIEDYYREQRAINDRFKLSTPWGKVNKRKVTKYNYDDEAVLTWLDKHNRDDLIRFKRELNKLEIKKPLIESDQGFFVDANGEMVDGVTVYVAEEVSIVAD